MDRIALVALSIIVATLLLVGASLGAELVQPYLWQATQQSWFLPLIAGVVPGLYVIAQRLRRKRPQT
jgi:membrane protein DedA with SNARE-associated domain